MIEKFYPNIMVDSIQDIDLEGLAKKNIKGFILDIDNTLVPFHIKQADENAVKWIEKLKNAGFKACIVSNNSKKRVIKFNEHLKLYAIHRASKPGTKAFMKAARLMETKPEEIAVVGDQIFTDVYGGNKVNMLTILVKPLNKRESVFIKTKRLAEKFVMASYRRKNKV